MPRPSNFKHPLAKLRALVPGLTHEQFTDGVVKRFPMCRKGGLAWLANHHRWCSNSKLLQLRNSDPALSKDVLKSVLKQLAQLLPVMKQPVLAELIGCSGSTVQAIELGGRPLKEDLAWRIFYATGASATALMKPKPELKGFDGNRYNFTTYQRWKAANRLGEDDHSLVVRTMSQPLTVVLAAAGRATGGSDLAIRHSYLRWLVATVEEFGLLGQIHAMRAEGKFPAFDPVFLDLTLGAKELETKNPWLGGCRTIKPEPQSKGFRPPNAGSARMGP